MPKMVILNLIQIRDLQDIQANKDLRATAVACRIRITREVKCDREDRAKRDLQVIKRRIVECLLKMVGLPKLSIRDRLSRDQCKVDQ